MELQTDLQLEAQNLEEFRANFADCQDTVIFPRPVRYDDCRDVNVKLLHDVPDLLRVCFGRK